MRFWWDSCATENLYSTFLLCDDYSHGYRKLFLSHSKLIKLLRPFLSRCWNYFTRRKINKKSLWMLDQFMSLKSQKMFSFTSLAISWFPLRIYMKIDINESDRTSIRSFLFTSHYSRVGPKCEWETIGGGSKKDETN